MTNIDLPHSLEAYFAFAEIASTRQSRRFTITFPYFDGQRLDRLQWWWHVSLAQERIVGEAGMEALRQEAIERFRQHIQRWLTNSRNRLYDGLPFPRLASLAPEEEIASADAPAEPLTEDQTTPVWAEPKVANG